MSIEFAGTPQPPLTQTTAESVLAHLLGTFPCTLVRESENGYGLQFRGPDQRVEWPEDLALSLDANQVYVAFHSATKGERESFLVAIQDALHAHGIVCSLEEL